MLKAVWNFVSESVNDFVVGFISGLVGFSQTVVAELRAGNYAAAIGNGIMVGVYALIFPYAIFSAPKNVARRMGYNIGIVGDVMVLSCAWGLLVSAFVTFGIAVKVYAVVSIVVGATMAIVA